MIKKLKKKIFEDSYKITINLPLEGIKIKDIILVLDKKVKNTEEKFEELYNIISLLKTENNNLNKIKKI